MIGLYNADVDSIDNFAMKVGFDVQGNENTGDYPYDFEELATGHTKKFVYKPPNISPYFWEPIVVGDAEKKDVGKYVPSWTSWVGSGPQDPKRIYHNGIIYVDNHNGYSVSRDRNKFTSLPGLYLTQPQIPSESGNMKFIYRLCVEFSFDYIFYMRPRAYLYDKTFNRNYLNLPTPERYLEGGKQYVQLVTVSYQYFHM